MPLASAVAGYRTSLADTRNRFRGLRADKIALLRLTKNKHSIELEMVLHALKHGLRVRRVPAHEYARRDGQYSLSVVGQAPTFLWCLVRNIW